MYGLFELDSFSFTIENFPDHSDKKIENYLERILLMIKKGKTKY
jgi:hypothetical protein